MNAGVWSNSLRAGSLASSILGRSANTDCRTRSTMGSKGGGKSLGTVMLISGAGESPACGYFLRRVTTNFSKATQSGISVRRAKRDRSAVRMTASASLPASSNSSAFRPMLSAIQVAALTSNVACWRWASSAWYSGSVRSDHLASSGMWSSVKPVPSFMPKWLFCGMAISNLSMSEPPLERDRKELSRKASAARRTSPPLVCSRYRLTKLTMRSRAFSSSGRKNSVPK